MGWRINQDASPKVAGISQGSVPTQWRCGGIFSDDCCGFAAESDGVKPLKVSIWQSYGKKYSGILLDSRLAGDPVLCASLQFT